jgi:hypothetical protein
MVLEYFHDSPLSGHLGTFKTFKRIAANFWWPGIRNEIFQYVCRCEACQRAKPAQNAQVGKRSAQPASRPLERLFIDFVGPLPRTRWGSVAILVVVDAFNKFLMFFPVRRISSSVVAECLENTYFPAFGTPKVIVSDNAKVFRCRVFRDVCFRWGVEHVTTAPYYPQGSLAERVNQNLKSALKIYHAESQDKWDTDLPWFATALNTAVHESTHFSPDCLFLGREVSSPLSVKWDLSSVPGDNQQGPNQMSWAQAFENLKQARERVANRYDEKWKEHVCVGQFCNVSQESDQFQSLECLGKAHA